MEEETTKSLHLRKEQGYVLGSEILTKPHPWDSWTPGPTNTEAYSENTIPVTPLETSTNKQPAREKFSLKPSVKGKIKS